ncbi:MAG: hypothetical protein K2H43_06450, partial [Clostridia bacterium]|nr:hypothetical protein [Clostridia bacterium]
MGLPKGDENGTEEEQLLAKMFAMSGLESMIGYTGNSASAVTTGSAYRASYNITPTADFEKNYRLASMPDGTTVLPPTLEWKIEPKEINAPQNVSTLTFSGNAYDLLREAGLAAEDAGLYYTVSSFKKRNEKYELVDVSEEITGVVNAGEYTITVDLVDKANMKWIVNGIQKTSAQKYTVTIGKLVITVSDWEGEGEEPFTPIYNGGAGDIPAGLIENEIVDSNGNVIGPFDWDGRWNQTFTQRLKPTAGNENNIEIIYAEGVAEEVTFTVGDDPDNQSMAIQRPTYTGTTGDGVKESVFNGEAQNFTPEGLADLVSANRVKLYAVDENGNEREVDA